MNRTMRIITLITGLVLIALGLYQAFVPQEVVGIGEMSITAKEGFTGESIAFILAGVVAFIFSFYKPK